MQYLNVFGRLLLIMVVFLWACDKQEDLREEDLIITEAERNVMTNCDRNAYTNRSDIEKNLVGEWSLIGYGCGFCAPHSPPDAKIIFTNAAGTLTFSSDFMDTEIIDFTWSLARSTNIFGDSTFVLETEPFHHALRLQVFCPDYMYVDNTPLDGNMFLYDKK